MAGVRSFGSGTLWGVRSDIANATPVNFGTLQEVQVGFTGSNAELRGAGLYPELIARKEMKVSCSAKMGRIDGRIFADLFLGASLATGQTGTTANAEAAAVPAPSGPYTVTVANAANYVSDLGVVNAANGLRYGQVASGPTTGQYSVNQATGVYTFAAADAGVGLLISYRYKITGTGQTVQITQTNAGINPVFGCTLETTVTGPTGLEKAVLSLNANVASKWSLPTKLGSFNIADFAWDAFADNAGVIGNMSLNLLS